MPERRDLNDTCLGLKSKNLYVLCICISVPFKWKQWTHSERFMKLPNSSKKSPKLRHCQHWKPHSLQQIHDLFQCFERSWPHMSWFLLKMAASPHLQRQAPALVMAASLLKSLAAGAAAEQVPKKLGICREGRMGKHMLERNGVDIGHQEARRIYRNCMVYCIVYNYIYIYRATGRTREAGYFYCWWLTSGLGWRFLRLPLHQLSTNRVSIN